MRHWITLGGSVGLTAEQPAHQISGVIASSGNRGILVLKVMDHLIIVSGYGLHLRQLGCERLSHHLLPIGTSLGVRELQSVVA